MKVTIKNGSFEWIKDCMSFEHGVTIAKELHERLGLIGRTYVYGSDGQTTWII